MKMSRELFLAKVLLPRMTCSFNKLGFENENFFSPLGFITKGLMVLGVKKAEQLLHQC